MTQPLPTSGPLGKRKDYEVTNRDLYDNALEQNKAINGVKNDVNEVKGTVSNLTTNVQTLAITVQNHARVIELLQNIKNIAIWLLAFLGLGGIASLFGFIKTWWQNSGH